MRLPLQMIGVAVIAVLMGGCMHPVEIHFVDAASRQPLADLPMTKARVASALFIEAVQAEGLQADQQGVVTVSDFGDHDQLIVEHDGRVALIICEGQQLWVRQSLAKESGTVAVRIGPDADSPSGKPRYTVALRSGNAAPSNPRGGQVVQAW